MTTIHSSFGKILRLRRVRLRSGFSFAEVMFAVVILGVGFVMVCAIFPIAVEQTRSTTDDAAAAQLARDCMHSITTVTHAEDYPDNGGITQAFADVIPLWSAISGSLISNTNPRYACVPFFSKSPVDGTVRITVLVVRRWSHDAYTAQDIGGDGELIPRGISVASITRQPDGTDVAEITHDQAGMDQAISTGTFLIMRSGDGDVPGRTYRISQKKSETSQSTFWTLAPGSNLLPDESVSTASAAVIGRDWIDPANSASGYTGPAQDVAVYTTFLRPH